MASRPLSLERSSKTERSDLENTRSRRWTPTFKALAVLFFLAVAFYNLYPSLAEAYYTFYPQSPTPHVASEKQFLEAPPYSPWDTSSRPPPVEPADLFYVPPDEAYALFNDTEWEENDWFDPMKRYNLNYGKVACWQDNGVWIKYLTPVEMSFLGVDRFQDTDRAAEQADEDAFCARLRMLGASFWELPPDWPPYIHSCWTVDQCNGPVKDVRFEVGYPTSGGVWVLDTNQGWDWPKGVKLRNALTMDERCEVLKGFGGVFCENPAACPELARLMGDPVGL